MGWVRSRIRGPGAAGLLAALAVLATLLLAACAGSDGDEPEANSDSLLGELDRTTTTLAGPPRPDVCRLLTDGDLGQATGGEVDDRTAGTGTGGDPSCTWQVVHGGDDSARMDVIVIVYEAGQLTFDADRGDPGSEPVSDLGAGAYWQSPVSVLNVLAGTRNLTVQVNDAAGLLRRPRKDVAVDLARAALGRL